MAEVGLKFEKKMKFKKSFFVLLIILYVEKGCLAEGNIIKDPFINKYLSSAIVIEYHIAITKFNLIEPIGDQWWFQQFFCFGIFISCLDFIILDQWLKTIQTSLTIMFLQSCLCSLFG